MNEAVDQVVLVESMLDDLRRDFSSRLPIAGATEGELREALAQALGRGSMSTASFQIGAMVRAASLGRSVMLITAVIHMSPPHMIRYDLLDPITGTTYANIGGYELTLATTAEIARMMLETARVKFASDRIDQSLARQLSRSMTINAELQNKNRKLLDLVKQIADALPTGVVVTLGGQPIDHAKLNDVIVKLKEELKPVIE